MNDRYSKELDQLYRKSLGNELNRIERKKYVKEHKIAEIEKLGLSTKQQSALKKELLNFKIITSERILGSSDYVVIGKSKVLNDIYVKVSYCKWSRFMNNVKGCSSLAGKRDINEVVELTQEEYNKLYNSNTVHKTHFIGMNSERIVASNGDVIQER